MCFVCVVCGRGVFFVGVVCFLYVWCVCVGCVYGVCGFVCVRVCCVCDVCGVCVLCVFLCRGRLCCLCLCVVCLCVWVCVCGVCMWSEGVYGG